jgi:hypothetical protein
VIATILHLLCADVICIEMYFHDILHRFPFRMVFGLGQRKKSQGAQSGEGGRWRTNEMLCLAKNSFTFRAAEHGTLLRCRKSMRLANKLHLQDIPERFCGQPDTSSGLQEEIPDLSH